MIETALLSLLQVLLLFNWPVALILSVAAWRRPRILALTVMAVLTFLIALALTVYVWAAFNAGAGYPIPREAAQIVFRLLLVGFGLFPLWFLWLFLTDRFGRPAK